MGKIIPLIAATLLVTSPLLAQQQSPVTPALTYGAAETKKTPPVVPVFWSATLQQPPLPFNPFPDLPLYDAGTNNYVYDDRAVDYPALRAAQNEAWAKEQAEAGSLEPAGGGPAMLMSSSSTNLTLAAPVFDGTNVQLTIENGVEGEFYDLFYSTNLVDWYFYVRTDIDQFEFSIVPPAWPACFFRLGTQQDSDGDSLTDAYELLVAQTDPNSPDTAQSVVNLVGLPFQVISNLVTWLTDHPPVRELYIYERDYGDLFLNSPCDYGPGNYNHFDSYSERTRWTNGVGGFYTNLLVMNYCTNNGSATSNTIAYEGRIAADVSGTNQFRQRVDDGAWTDWADDWAGVTPWCGNLSNDWSYRRTATNATWTVSPSEVHRLTDTTTTSIRYSTRGQQFSTAERRHKITVLAVDFGSTVAATNVPGNLIQFPGLQSVIQGSTAADSNGVLYVTLRDNTTKFLTPVLPAAFSNYSYIVTAERHLIPLNFRNTGYLTGPGTNGTGYDFNKYTDLIRYAATNLGVHAAIDDGTAVQKGSNWINVEEISATVPTSPYLNWAWHQDKQLKRYLWTNGAAQVTVVGSASFSTMGPDGGNDVPPQGGTLDDSEPDSLGNVYFPDAPSLTITETILANAPVGSVAALRFYGHTWLTGNAAFASSILKWRTFITIKKTTNGWERVGPDNFIDLTPNNDPEQPEFPVSEASGL